MKISSSIKKVQRKIYLTEETSNKLDILLLDPVRGRVKYGELSDIAEALFIRWIEEQVGAHGANAKTADDVDGGPVRAEAAT